MIPMPTYIVKNPKELGSVIQDARISKGLAQKDTAEAIAVNRQYIVGIESGTKNLYGTRLFRLIRSLGLTVTVSWGEPTNESKQAATGG
jgi:transcriptional regulator with XRE-family HTH domain